MKRLMAVVFLLVFYCLPSESQTLKCNEFWPQMLDQQSDCVSWTPSPTSFKNPGVEMRFFQRTSPNPPHKQSQEILSTMADVIARAVPLYNKWFKTRSIYTIFFDHTEEDGTFSEQTSINPNLEQPCRISLFLNISHDQELARQIGAHEIFHCIQDQLVFHTSAEVLRGIYSYDWWTEGSANCFAAYPFPRGGLDIQHGNTYRFEEPLYLQPNPYSTVIFFDTLRTQFAMSYGEIGNLLKRQPADSSFASERKALTTWPRIDEMFFRFARAVADKDIRNAGNIPYDFASLAYGETQRIPSQNSTLQLEVRPFTIAPLSLQIPRGHRVKIWPNKNQVENSKFRISYREISAPVWSELTVSARELQTTCIEAEFNGLYKLLITSVADSNRALPLNLHFEVLQTEECALTHLGKFGLNGGKVELLRSPVMAPFW